MPCLLKAAQHAETERPQSVLCKTPGAQMQAATACTLFHETVYMAATLISVEVPAA